MKFKEFALMMGVLILLAFITTIIDLYIFPLGIFRYIINIIGGFVIGYYIAGRRIE